MYLVGPEKIPLCLDCYFKVAQILQQQNENNERTLNYAAQQMEFIAGLPGVTPQFPPRPKAVYVQGAKLNNISVSNSVVGTINTGSLGTVDQSISALVQIGEPEMAGAVKGLSEAILTSADLTRNQQNELVEILGAIAKQAATPKAARENSVATTLIERAVKLTSLAGDIAETCNKYWPILVTAFNAVTGGS